MVGKQDCARSLALPCIHRAATDDAHACCPLPQAYAMVFVVIAGWIVFRFVGPATGLYSLKANLQDIPSMTQ